MRDRHVNYDEIAPTYNQRYAVNPHAGITAALLALARKAGVERILEVGCGTGRWLAELQQVTRQVYGVDRSPGMLQQARHRNERFFLACGDAAHLPFAGATFDLVLCVNAFHHFDEPRVFLSEARRLLRSGGALAIIGMDPHAGRDRWYIYDYFKGTYETDLRRFPARETMVEWMSAAGFSRVEWELAERITHQLAGRDVFKDPTLQKNGTSQLALLTDEAYAAGLSRIETAQVEAEARGQPIVFPVDISLVMLTGRL